MRSTDTGIQWEELALPSSSQVIAIALSPEFAEDRTVVVSTREELFLSQDGGDSWMQLYPDKGGTGNE